MRPLAGGERLLGMRVAYTPGHASHHVCYMHEDSGTAFIGDVAGGADSALRSDRCHRHRRPTSTSRPGSSRSGSSKRGSRCASALTHFGAVENPAEHLAVVRERLREEASLARRLSEPEYEQHHREWIENSLDPETAAELLQAVPPPYQWSGLNRYWRKRERSKPRSARGALASARPPL